MGDEDEFDQEDGPVDPALIRVPEDLPFLPEGAVRVSTPSGREGGAKRSSRPAQKGSWGKRRKTAVNRGTRRRARELAVQALYQCAAVKGSMSQAVLQIGKSKDPGRIDLDYFEKIALGTWDAAKALDEKIDAAAQRWASERIALIDRSILRLALYELMAEGAPPARIIINEAVELSKRFGGSGSSRFVNGVLDGMVAQQGRRHQEVSEADEGQNRE
ncbi:MAG: transcription antitermination factor NusB [Magnetococcales bacterium]|nr:transcription antitermination factor NusB [Magnetococcales bacterium]